MGDLFPVHHSVLPFFITEQESCADEIQHSTWFYRHMTPRIMKG
jgi:hypothetical protein